MCFCPGHCASLSPKAAPICVNAASTMASFTNLLALAFFQLAACQNVALQGRFLPLGSSQSSSSLPTAVSWPASQISASFVGSSAVTAVVKDLTYATSSQLALLPAGIQLLVNGGGTAALTQAQDTFYFTIGNLPKTSATVTLTKQDESVLGGSRVAATAPDTASPVLPREALAHCRWGMADVQAALNSLGSHWTALPLPSGLSLHLSEPCAESVADVISNLRPMCRAGFCLLLHPRHAALSL